MLTDAHCHLERETYGEELDAVLARAQAAGVSHAVAVGASRVTEGAREAIALAERVPWIVATAGVHPHEAASASHEACEAIRALLDHPKVVALGEVGLDYYYDNSPRDMQRHVFARFLKMAHAAEQPVMLHVRDAHDDCFSLLDDVGVPPRGGIVHCFSAGPEEAAQYLARGLYLSIPGIVTFKNAVALREAVTHAPLDRLLIETDSPYLAPVPHRGKRNEPAYVRETAAAIAALRGLTLEEVARITTVNAIAVYGLTT